MTRAKETSRRQCNLFSFAATIRSTGVSEAFISVRGGSRGNPGITTWFRSVSGKSVLGVILRKYIRSVFQACGRSRALSETVSEMDRRDIQASLDGEGEAYARLVRRYQNEIAAQMRRFTGRQETIPVEKRRGGRSRAKPASHVNGCRQAPRTKKSRPALSGNSEEDLLPLGKAGEGDVAQPIG